MRQKRFLSILLAPLVILVMSIALATNASGEWVIETVDSDGDTGAHSSIAIDSQDNVHLSYYDKTNERLKYTTNASGVWDFVTIPSNGRDEGSYSSIAIDSQDNVHISYSDRTNLYLKYATNSYGGWQMRIIDGFDLSTIDLYERIWVTGNNSIAIDSQDNVHLSYVGICVRDYINKITTEQCLKYATNTWGWDTQIFSPMSDNVDYTSSMAIDSDDDVHISYYDKSGRICFIYSEDVYGNLWWYPFDNDGVSQCPSIAIDSQDNVHLSYYDKTNERLIYTRGFYTRGFVTQAIFNDGGCPSMAIDSQDNVHISYSDHTNYNLKYATSAFRGMGDSIVEREGAGGPSIAIDSQDNVHISYYDNINDDLKYAKNNFRDTDGILNIIDGYMSSGTFIDESSYYSDNFTDERLGGTTSGNIVNRDELTIDVEDADPGGVRIIASGSVGIATINTCGMDTSWDDGDSVIIECGSLATQVLKGEIEIEVTEKIYLIVPAGATAIVTGLCNGKFSIENSPTSQKSITVLIYKEPYELSPGTSGTFSENRPPVAVCQDTAADAVKNCQATASIDGGSYDPDGDPIAVAQSPAGPYGLGKTLVTLAVTDSSDESDSCIAEVKVKDTDTPVILCPADTTLECDDSTNPSNTGQATATDNCDEIPTVTYTDISTQSSDNCQEGNSYEITRTWTATDASWNEDTCTQVITVEYAELDTDTDGLTDADEIQVYGTEFNNPDTDNDGLNDGLEVLILGTNPLLTDSDGNGIQDGEEDNDLDGYTNAKEIKCGSDLMDPNSKCVKGMPWLMLLLD